MFARQLHQGQMPVVQRPHGRHQRNAFAAPPPILNDLPQSANRIRYRQP
jgi:hypothetical protein